VVDASGSMGSELLELGRSLALALLRQAYVRRDRVAMIAFRGEGAELLFGPTTQQELLRRAVSGLPVGGTTPLSSGLALAAETLDRARRSGGPGRAVLALLSDGHANVPAAGAGHRRVVAEAEAAARDLACRADLDRLLVDATPEGKDDRPAEALSGWLDARRVRLCELRRAGRDPAEIVERLLCDP
jgi:magnesium chelatase subunit D